MALRRRVRTDNTWPGFVDALSTLLLAIIFLLVVFVLSHFVLSQALTGRDEELTRLNRQIAELAGMLALEQQATSEMRETVSQLSASLQESTRARDLLTLRIDDLKLEIEQNTNRADRAEAELAAARQEIDADREKIKLQVRELVSLRRDIDALRQVRANLEQRVADLAAAVTERDREIGALRDRTKALQTSLASQAERTSLAQKEIEAREIRIEELIAQVNLAKKDAETAKQDVVSEQFISARAQNRVTLLNQQIAALRQQLVRLEAALQASEAKDKEQQTQISDLGRRLNVALARRVEELSKYRSEFFGRLREVLGDRADITVVGDRFVFQSEVLFETGSADLGDQGQVQLGQFATTLREISSKIPTDIPWVIRVDGHTDSRPIATPQFPSNWELSAARAIAVTRFLMAQGI
ncbi:MAG: OmpA family protein, partial [Proteobacteria bacterium]|nr:OmpA family protein [Pseudomonadota bacterium]